MCILPNTQHYGLFLSIIRGKMVRLAFFYPLRTIGVRWYGVLRFYGVSADLPYCRKKTMSCLVQGGHLNQAGSLEFRVMRDGDMADPDFQPCLPVGSAVYGADFSFSIVFW